MRQMTVRAALTGVLLSVIAPALAQAPHRLEDFAGQAEIFGDLEAANLRLTDVQTTDALFGAADGKPASAHLAQEGIAAALWTGRIFLAHGKQLDDRVVRIAFDPADSEAPDGWKRDENKLTHVESGLSCPIEMNLSDKKKKRSLALFDIAQYDQRGRDVSCNYSADGAAALTLYASFYPDLSAEDHAKGAVAAIRQNFTIKKVLPVTVAEVSRKTADGEEVMLPSPVAAGFDVGDINGVPYKTSLWLAKTHGWHVKSRATYPQEDISVEVIAALLFAVNYSLIDTKNQANPTADGDDV